MRQAHIQPGLVKTVVFDVCEQMCARASMWDTKWETEKLAQLMSVLFATVWLPSIPIQVCLVREQLRSPILSH